MQTILLVIYLMVVVALIGVVLIQRSEGGGLGIGGGSGFMSARGTANALTRTTAILATLFFVLALGMGIYARYETRPTDILDRIPGTTGTGGVLDALGGGQSQQNGGTQQNQGTQGQGTQNQGTQGQGTEGQGTGNTTNQTPATTGTDAVPTEGGNATTGAGQTPATTGGAAETGGNTGVPSGQ
ncbi:preprotein translocase subunit SecG [Shinella oryzae]|uniref:Protein-export membrane protein SecG n=1 Tax=Shinella oryzae TaxID=2871820 RepID=A0ABY9K191_9HYPH|nr:preprotein translocase subunit SecG [Shinella oryzae]WLS02348.1 preprotein translocase subunit SecG [Shinella oryzae]